MPEPDEVWRLALTRVEQVRATGQAITHPELVTVPLRSRETVLGTLTLTPARGSFHEADFNLIAQIAKQMALTIDNARLYENAQDAVVVRDEFISIASHELKTPLTPLLLQIQILLRALREKQSAALSREQLIKSFSVCERLVKRLAELSTELLDISRIKSGRLSLNYEEANFSLLVEDVLQNFAPELEKYKIPLTVKLEPGLSGNWDPLKTGQVISNLIANAVKYGEKKMIAVALRSQGPDVVFEVRDQGIGIAAEHHSRIFQCFERAVSGRHYGGLGLGLYIAKEIITAQGGRIEVESQIGAGSLFRIVLPRDPNSISPQEPPPLSA